MAKKPAKQREKGTTHYTHVQVSVGRGSGDFGLISEAAVQLADCVEYAGFQAADAIGASVDHAS